MNATLCEIEIRRMHGGDLEAVRALAASLDDAPHCPPQVYVTALDAQAAPRRIALVAVDHAGAIAGFAIASLVAPEAELETVAVAAGAQRQGIGRRLLGALIEEMQAAAVSEFLLEVRASNVAAVGLYRTLGWRQTGRRPGYYANPVEDGVLMSLELG